MKIYQQNLPAKRKRCVATIGVFDGLHLGHKFILEKLRCEASRLKIPSLVITFDAPPEKLLFKDFRGYLTDIEEKKALIKSSSIDYLWILKNSIFLLGLSGEEFIKYILKHFHICELIVGKDFRFGKGAEFDITHLKKLSQKYKFGVKIMEKKKNSGRIISSTLIRGLILRGKLKKVKMFLGRSYSVKGRIIKGKGYGRRLGFSTANIFPFDYILPRKGVYAGCAVVGGKTYLAALNYGRRPTVTKAKRQVLEAHLINFHKNILGQLIKFIFFEKIREEKKFSSLGKLSEAINKDTGFVIARYNRKIKFLYAPKI